MNEQRTAGDTIEQFIDLRITANEVAAISAAFIAERVTASPYMAAQSAVQYSNKLQALANRIAAAAEAIQSVYSVSPHIEREAKRQAERAEERREKNRRDTRAYSRRVKDERRRLGLCTCAKCRNRNRDYHRKQRAQKKAA